MKRFNRVFSSIVAFFGFSAATQQSFAALPTTAAPSRGASSGSYVELLQNYAYDAGILVGLVLATVAFLMVTSNAISVYSEISKGRKTFGDLTGHAVAGVLLIVFSVFLLTEAGSVL